MSGPSRSRSISIRSIMLRRSPQSTLSAAWARSCRRLRDVPSNGQPFRGCVQPDGHCCAGPQRGEQQVIGCRSRVVADLGRLVGEQGVASGSDRLAPCRLGASVTRTVPSGVTAAVARGLLDAVPTGPGAQHLGDIGGISRSGEEVVGVVEGHEALGCFATSKMRRALSISTSSSCAERERREARGSVPRWRR